MQILIDAGASQERIEQHIESSIETSSEEDNDDVGRWSEEDDNDVGRWSGEDDDHPWSDSGQVREQRCNKSDNKNATKQTVKCDAFSFHLSILF